MARWLRRHGFGLTLGALSLLLGLLALLQYRWTSEIARAETERRRAQLERSSAAFASALGRELGHVLAGFRLEPGVSPAERRRLLLAHLAALRAVEPAGLVSDVWLATRGHGGELELERCAPGANSFASSAWTPRIAFLRELAARATSGDAERGRPGREGSLLRPFSLRDPPPMLVVPLLDVSEQGRSDPPGSRWMRLGVSGLAAVELDETHLRERLLPQLAEAHFGPLAASELIVAVLRRADGSVVYSSAPDLPAAELKRADVEVPLFDLARSAVWAGADGRGRGSPAAGISPPPPPGEAGFVVHFEGGAAAKGDAARPPFVFESGPGPRGAWARRPGDGRAPWLLTIRHRGGSLEQAVSRLANRNLALGLGVLALLGAAAVLLVVGVQRARRLARQQLEFVAGVTHELNTPLAGIRSAGQNLSAGIVTDPDRVRRYGEMIEQEGRRLTAIVAQVLDFAGIESGRRAYAAEPLPLAALVDEVVTDLRLPLEEAGVSLEKDLPADLPAVRGDASALRRVIANLLTNAIKFGAAGKRIRVNAEGRAGGGTVRLRVEDAGPGILPAERERVFEPFYRGSAAQRNDTPGSGLGLSLVRRIVQALGGRVWIEAPNGGGTAVVVELRSAETGAGVGA